LSGAIGLFNTWAPPLKTLGAGPPAPLWSTPLLPSLSAYLTYMLTLVYHARR